MSHGRRVAVAVLLQLLILVAIAGARQWTLSTGEVVLLETSPVDPRDPFRGDYIVLNYFISSLNASALGSAETFSPGQTVYVGLEQRGKFWEAVSVGSARPSTTFLRGTVRTGGQTIRVDYGIESYFVQEGAGLQVSGLTPLIVEAVVGRDGSAVIRNVFIDGQPIR